MEVIAVITTFDGKVKFTDSNSEVVSEIRVQSDDPVKGELEISLDFKCASSALDDSNVWAYIQVTLSV